MPKPPCSGARELPALQTLRQLWAEQYTDPPGPTNKRREKRYGLLPRSDYVPLRYRGAHKPQRGMDWIGYKVHFTETCDEKNPHLITHVETTVAAVPDDQMLPRIHQALDRRDLLPAVHLVDAGYTNAQGLVSGQAEYGVSILGPMAQDASWQIKAAEGFDKENFIVDWEAQTVTCPAGKQSLSWRPCVEPAKRAAIHIRFSRKDCSPCPSRSRCTHAKLEPRELLLQKREEYEALHMMRQRQTTPEFRAQYAQRAGIEATHAQGVRRCDLRQTRSIGLAKTRLQHILTAIALHIVRTLAWWNEIPLAPTRQSHFAALQLKSI